MPQIIGMNLQLSDEETALLERELRNILDNYRYFFSPCCRTLRETLNKIRSEPTRRALTRTPTIRAARTFLPTLNGDSTRLINTMINVCREPKTVRIAEILFWNNKPTERNPTDLELDLPPAPFFDDPKNLANAFTRHGLVKSFWNLAGSEGQPSGPAPPSTGTKLIPDGTSEPTTASLRAEPVEVEPPVGPHRLFPFR
jgi:hypothetical protein